MPNPMASLEGELPILARRYTDRDNGLEVEEDKAIRLGEERNIIGPPLAHSYQTQNETIGLKEASTSWTDLLVKR